MSRSLLQLAALLIWMVAGPCLAWAQDAPAAPPHVRRQQAERDAAHAFLSSGFMTGFFRGTLNNIRTGLLDQAITREGLERVDAEWYTDAVVLPLLHANRPQLEEELVDIFSAHYSLSALQELDRLSRGSLREPLQLRLAPALPLVQAAAIQWAARVITDNEPAILAAIRRREGR